MKPRGSIRATTFVGVALVAIAGVVATCGGPVAFARSESAGGGRSNAGPPRLETATEVLVGNPEATTMLLPVAVVREVSEEDSATGGGEATESGGQRRGLRVAEDHAILEAEVAIDGGRHDGKVVGRARGKHQGAVHVPVDLTALGLTDGETRKVKVTAKVASTGASGGGAARARQARARPRCEPPPRSRSRPCRYPAATGSPATRTSTRR